MSNDYSKVITCPVCKMDMILGENKYAPLMYRCTNNHRIIMTTINITSLDEVDYKNNNIIWRIMALDNQFIFYYNGVALQIKSFTIDKNIRLNLKKLAMLL